MFKLITITLFILFAGYRQCLWLYIYVCIYYAYVIEHDAGATGGSTMVDVYENFKLDLLLFEIKKIGKRLYDGNWGEGRNMEVYWKDNDTLVINSIEYNIS